MNDQQKLHQLILAALFAAAIAVMTAYLLHIPIPTGGYIHLGDTLIYLSACLLPMPYAVMAAVIGGGLAACLLLGNGNAFVPQFLGTLVQGIGSGVLFAVLALALDRAEIKTRLRYG